MLNRPAQDGYATIWDGNKYIQCSRAPTHGLRCEAAGPFMQPSLHYVLTPERIGRLTALGWRLDPSFGNFTQVFSDKAPTSQIAGKILQALKEAYDAQTDDVEVQSAWIAADPCPPRHAFSQSLAGMVDDDPAMANATIHACAFKPDAGLATPPAKSTEDLIALYGVQVTAEIQRLRVNIARKVFVVFDTGIGYVQCGPQTSPDAFFCEAQSAESWPALASVLTSDRVARLHALGYADPGHSENYSKAYPASQFSDVAVMTELLTVLHDVYGYNGASPLETKTEAEASSD